MPEIIWLNTYEAWGSFSTTTDRIEISTHFPPELKQKVLDHELEHWRRWKDKGFLSFPRQIWIDYRDSFIVFSNRRLYTQLQELKHKTPMDWKDHIFQIVYNVAMIGNPIAMIAGTIVRLGRKLYAKLF